MRWLCCCFWWNPLVWLRARRMRGLVEELCEREGAGDLSEAPAYARLLLRVSEERLLGTGGVAMSGSAVAKRIGRVVDERAWRELRAVKARVDSDEAGELVLAEFEGGVHGKLRPQRGISGVVQIGGEHGVGAIESPLPRVRDRGGRG